MRRTIMASALTLAFMAAATGCREQGGGGSATGGIDTVRDTVRDTLQDTVRDTVRDTTRRDTTRDTTP